MRDLLERGRFEINPMNKQTNNWRKELRTIQAMTLALCGMVFVCGLCIGYLLAIL